MSDQDPFKEETSTETPSSSNTNPWEDQLSAIVNENGEQKYKDVETALKALQASQEHIRKLEQEKKELASSEAEKDAELAKIASIEDFVNRISPNAQPAPAKETPKPEDVLSEDKVAKMLQETLDQRQEAAVQADNLSKVNAALVKAHGDKTTAFVQKRAEELDTTPAALKEMAKSNPTLVLNLLGGVAESNPDPAPSLSAINSPTQPREEGAPEFKTGIARGGLTNAELVERFKKVAEYTNKKLGVES